MGVNVSVLNKETLTSFAFFRSLWVKSLIFFVFFCVGISQSNAQFYDMHLTQYMFNPLPWNPGYAGMSGKVNAFVNNRNQYMGIEGSPTTTFIGADMALNVLGNQGGVGLMVFSEQIGYYNNLLIQGIVSQKFDLGDGKLGIGLNFGVVNMVLDGTKFNPKPHENDYHVDGDLSIPTTEVSGIGFDSGIGVYYKAPKYYAGISIMHLFNPEPNFKDEFNVYMPRIVYLSAGYNHALWEVPVTLMPSFMVRKSEGIWSFDINMNVLYKEKFWGGLSYRLQEGIAAIVGLELPSGLKVGYSYDIPMGAVSFRSSGTHEVLLGYVFDISFGKRDKKYKNVRFL